MQISLTLVRRSTETTGLGKFLDLITINLVGLAVRFTSAGTYIRHALTGRLFKLPLMSTLLLMYFEISKQPNSHRVLVDKKLACSFLVKAIVVRVRISNQLTSTFNAHIFKRHGVTGSSYNHSVYHQVQIHLPD